MVVMGRCRARPLPTRLARGPSAANKVGGKMLGSAGISATAQRHSACFTEGVTERLEKSDRADSQEISVATGVFRVSSQRLTTYCVKTYPSAAAREGSVRTSSLISIALRLPSRSQAQQCQGRRPFQELFQ
jgi:hypothetical protein